MLETDKAELLHRALKIIEEPLNWKPRGQGYRLEADVWCPELEEGLQLSCNYGRTNYGFSLLYQKYTIRRYDSCARHKSHSTRQVLLHTPHKHIWNQENEDDEAYVPQDIHSRDNVNDQLFAFLKEENIELRGDYQRLMI